jgi:fructose-1,6-bisphosphatase/inositol monophosphatase family enzyme
MTLFLTLLRECAHEIGEAVKSHRGRGLSGARATQYHLDVAADDVAVRVLGGAGFRVVSEESGVTGNGEFTVVVDPIDGSTNCDRGIPFYATSLAVMRDDELVAGLVMNQARDVFEAQKGAGATSRRITPFAPSGKQIYPRRSSVLGLSVAHLGWAQYRALGAASLEICLVADGSLDVYAVAQQSTLNPWDYLAGMLIAREAGAVRRTTETKNSKRSAAVVFAHDPVFAVSSRAAVGSDLHSAGLLSVGSSMFEMRAI